MKMSRRQAIYGSASLALALYETNLLHALANPPITPWRTLFQPDHPQTPFILDTYFPSYRTDANLSSLLRFTAIVRNGGKTPVKGYSLTWGHQEGGNGPSTTFNRLYVSEPSPEMPSTVIGTGWNHILQPGEFAVATPLFLWSASKFRRHHGHIPVETLFLTQDEAPAFILSAENDSRFWIRRDAKICRHKVIGSDIESDTSCITSYESAINVERAVAQTLVQEVSPSDPASLQNAIDALLSQQMDAADPAENAVRTRFLLTARKRIKRFGAPLVLHGVQRIASRRPLSLIAEKRVHIHKAIA